MTNETYETLKTYGIIFPNGESIRESDAYNLFDNVYSTTKQKVGSKYNANENDLMVQHGESRLILRKINGTPVIEASTTDPNSLEKALIYLGGRFREEGHNIEIKEVTKKGALN